MQNRDLIDKMMNWPLGEHHVMANGLIAGLIFVGVVLLVGALLFP